MNRYHEKMNKIVEMANKEKVLSQQAIENLRLVIEDYMDENVDDINDVLPFIINYVFNEAYRAAANDILQVLRTRGDTGTNVRCKSCGTELTRAEMKDNTHLCDECLEALKY